MHWFSAGTLAAVVVSGVCFTSGCLRFPDDSAPDASATEPDSLDANDSSYEVDGSGTRADALSDVAPLPPPVCQRFDPSIAELISEDMVSTLLVDCRIRSYFLSIPPVHLTHFQECFAAQLSSVFGCLTPDGKRFKYPAFDSQGQFCRDMQTAHASMSTSDGDFDAFVDDLHAVLGSHGFTDDEIARVLKVFASARVDIVVKKDAGPTAACQPDAAAAAGPEGGTPGTPEEASRDADKPDASNVVATLADATTLDSRTLDATSPDAIPSDGRLDALSDARIRDAATQ